MNVPAIRSDDMSTVWRLSQRLSSTEFVPDALRNRPEAVLAAVLYGRELGIGPMQALQSVNVIKGKPTLAPETMRALILRAGHQIATKEYTDERVTLVGTRDTMEETVTFTVDDAKRAGLIKTGGAWTTYPRAMLLARATSELARLMFADVIAGASYTPEELDHDTPIPVTAEVVPDRDMDVVDVTGPDSHSHAAAGTAGDGPVTTSEDDAI